MTACTDRGASLGSTSFIRVALLLVVLAVAVILPRAARADVSSAHSVSVAVLSFESEDAEEQADALTGALRSRIRASQGWSLVETSQSLGMLTAGLRCSGKPLPSDCQQRISEQIKSERYIYGYVTKGPVGQVTAEIHLYQKGKPDTAIKEIYADNLKDQNDDTLRKVAQRILDRLGGTAVGTVVVRMGTENGEVIVDGDKRIPLTNGLARLELAPGGHSVEVSTASGPPQKRNIVVTAGRETVIEMIPHAPAGDPGKDDKPFPTRKALGGGLAALGVVSGIVSIVFLTSYLDEKGQEDELREEARKAAVRDGLPSFDGAMRRNPEEQRLDDADSKAKVASGVAIATGIAGAGLLVGGAYLFLTSGDTQEKTGKAKAPQRTTRVTPTLGGLAIVGTF